MERLSCGISRMKRNNSIELLRGPKATQRHGENSKVNKCENVENNELLPGHGVKQGTFLMMQETLVDDDLFSLEIFSSSKLLFFFFFPNLITLMERTKKTAVPHQIQNHVAFCPTSICETFGLQYNNI